MDSISYAAFAMIGAIGGGYWAQWGRMKAIESNLATLVKHTTAQAAAEESGRIIAIEQKLETVLKNVETQTRVTESIKAEMTTKAWVRDTKKEIVFKTIKALAKYDAVSTRYASERRELDGGHAPEDSRRITEEAYMEAIEEIHEAKVFARVVCGADVETKLTVVIDDAIRFPEIIARGNGEQLHDGFQALTKSLQTAVSTLRDDLKTYDF